MNISEIKSGDRDVTITGTVEEVSEPRQIQTKYGPNTLTTVMVKDDTGSIKVSLWGNQSENVAQGSKVTITGAFVREWNGEIQVNIPRNGEIKVEA
ncbi:MAG: hypothetical protein J4432_01235 [DPANN group archaeon]|nr:hypothetical protein [DPANN group archaeon]